jgi:hypothetical protein
MQRYTIFFIAVNALHVSGGFFAHHQELKIVHTASGIYQACLLLPLAVAASIGLLPPVHGPDCVVWPEVAFVNYVYNIKIKYNFGG